MAVLWATGLTAGELGVSRLSGGTIGPGWSAVLFLANMAGALLLTLVRWALGRPHRCDLALALGGGVLYLAAATVWRPAAEAPPLAWPAVWIGGLLGVVGLAALHGVTRGEPSLSPWRGVLLAGLTTPWVAYGWTWVVASLPSVAAAPVITSAGIGAAAIALSGARLRGRTGSSATALAVLATLTCAVPWRAKAGSAVPHRDDPQPPPPASTRASVVLIVLDTVRARSLSTYGFPRPTTPRLDAFAATATTYTHCRSSSSWTLPTHASLFTGLYPTRHGAHEPGLLDRQWANGVRGLSTQVPTLPELLAAAGYATAGFAANHGVVGGRYGLDRGFRRWSALPARAPNWGSVAPLGWRLSLPLILRLPKVARWLLSPYRSGKEMSEEARRWLAGQPIRRPYFLFVNYMDGHTPWYSALARRWWTPRTLLPELGVRQTLDVRRGRPISNDEAAFQAGLYSGAIQSLDADVSHLLDALARRPDFKDTWVVVTADHGEDVGEHGLLGHGMALYEEQIHVPLIIREPGPSAGRRVDTPVQLEDIAPTLLSRIGLPVPDHLDGVLLGTRESSWAELGILGVAAAAPRRLWRESRAWIEGPFKYIRNRPGTDELFDLAADPLESRNLILERPDVASRLSRPSTRRKGSSPKPPPRAPSCPPMPSGSVPCEASATSGEAERSTKWCRAPYRAERRRLAPKTAGARRRAMPGRRQRRRVIGVTRPGSRPHSPRTSRPGPIP